MAKAPSEANNGLDKNRKGRLLDGESHPFLPPWRQQHCN